MESPVIYWFRNDFRLTDNPALRFAIETNKPVLFIYINDETEDSWRPGAASRWWLHHSLISLQRELASYNAKLHFFSGIPYDVLSSICKYSVANQIVCSRLYEPNIVKQDAKLKNHFDKDGISFDIVQGNLLFKPGSIKNKQGEVYKVFTPFYKACREVGLPSDIIDRPEKIVSYEYGKKSFPIDQLNLLPTIPWDLGLQEHWQPGESGAYYVLRSFIENNLAEYPEQRDFPAVDSTSHLSPHLHFGEISPMRINYYLVQCQNESPNIAEQSEKLTRQLVWREFSYHILAGFPHTSDEPFQVKFKQFPWKRSDRKLLTAWQQGKTGYPLIDAGMRELWHTGYMHNRVRMIVASFLTKNGLLHWKKGAQWFWDTLVDADLAQNSMNWQWVAGCGVDAAPYFRIFNPVTQSKRFDMDGVYIRRWCPELNQLPNKYIHSPSTAPEHVLAEANIKLGVNYPKPVLDLAETRERALSLFKDL